MFSIPKYVILSVVAAMLWGSSHVIDKLALSHMPPISVTILKYIGCLIVSLVAFALFFSNCVKSLRKNNSSENNIGVVRIPSRGVVLSLISGVVGAIGMFMFVNAILLSSEPHLVSSIVSIVPVFSLIIGFLFIKGVRIRLKQVIAMMVILAGVVMLSTYS